MTTMESLRWAPIFCLLGLDAVLASITIKDPSDVIDPQDWAADNAIVPDYNIPFPAAQPSDSELLCPFFPGPHPSICDT